MYQIHISYDYMVSSSIIPDQPCWPNPKPVSCQIKHVEHSTLHLIPYNPNRQCITESSMMINNIIYNLFHIQYSNNTMSHPWSVEDSQALHQYHPIWSACSVTISVSMISGNHFCPDTRINTDWLEITLYKPGSSYLSAHSDRYGIHSSLMICIKYDYVGVLSQSKWQVWA